jgi:CTP synthase (UTP-ammonia lyase)
LPNLETIYEVPLKLSNEGIDKIITKKLNLDKVKTNL